MKKKVNQMRSAKKNQKVLRSKRSSPLTLRTHLLRLCIHPITSAIHHTISFTLLLPLGILSLPIHTPLILLTTLCWEDTIIPLYLASTILLGVKDLIASSQDSLREENAGKTCTKMLRNGKRLLKNGLKWLARAGLIKTE
jgi:hypothetical protein